jgi:hypothetical protein
MDCVSPKPEVCKSLKFHDHGQCLSGYMWEVWEGKHHLSDQYRRFWRERARGDAPRGGGQPVAQADPKYDFFPCEYRAPVIGPDGRSKKIECG